MKLKKQHNQGDNDRHETEDNKQQLFHRIRKQTTTLPQLQSLLDALFEIARWNLLTKDLHRIGNLMDALTFTKRKKLQRERLNTMWIFVGEFD